MWNCRRNFLSYFASITDPIANLSKWQSYKLSKGVNDKHSQLWNLSHNSLHIMKGVHDTRNQFMDVTFNVSGSRPLWKEASHKVILNNNYHVEYNCTMLNDFIMICSETYINMTHCCFTIDWLGATIIFYQYDPLILGVNHNVMVNCWESKSSIINY